MKYQKLKSTFFRGGPSKSFLYEILKIAPKDGKQNTKSRTVTWDETKAGVPKKKNAFHLDGRPKIEIF